MSKVTIQSMAKNLGLSRNTVALALKNSEIVSPKTKEMVFRYAAKVGYIEGVPQKEKAEDIKKNVYHIMILRKADKAIYWDKVINGISREASKYNCQIHVGVITDEEEEEGQLPLGLDEQICAVFCVKLLKWDYLKKIKDKGYHIFLLDDYKKPMGETLGDVVRIEGVNPVILMMQHLLGQGMKRIGFLNEHSHTYVTMYERFVGYQEAMKQAGLVPEEELMKPDREGNSFYSPKTFEKLAEEYKRSMPEAIVCGNDQIAQRLTQAFRKIGVRVPEDIALTGFDDDEADHMDPFFTTVHVNANWLGQRMVQSFLWRMQNLDAPYEKIVVSGEVVFRKSSCKNTDTTGICLEKIEE